jgi:tetratricopeptide (TPR) repeat protein
MNDDPATDPGIQDPDILAVALEGAVSERDWYRAVAIGERLLTLRPGGHAFVEHTTRAHRAFAMHAEQNGDPATAFKEWTRCVELMPDLALQWYNRGLIQRKLGQTEGAIADFTRAIALDSTHANSLRQRGHCHRDMGNSEAALADFTRAIELRPDDASLRDDRGVVYLELHRV